jgi:hypothetical protein
MAGAEPPRTPIDCCPPRRGSGSFGEVGARVAGEVEQRQLAHGSPGGES